MLSSSLSNVYKYLRSLLKILLEKLCSMNKNLHRRVSVIQLEYSQKCYCCFWKLEDVKCIYQIYIKYMFPIFTTVLLFHTCFSRCGRFFRHGKGRGRARFLTPARIPATLILGFHLEKANMTE